MTFNFSSQGRVTISMEGFIKDLLISTKINGSSNTPANSNLFDIDEKSQLLNVEQQIDFHSIVAKLLYLAKRTRPDILLAVSFLTTRVNHHHPTIQDLTKLQRIISYINATRELYLTLSANNNDSIQVYAYVVDASHGSHANFKGHTGGIISIGSGVVHAKSSKQKLNSKSSSETELIGLSDYSSQVLWTQHFITAQGYNLKPATIYQDNQSTMAMVRKVHPTAESTRRHILIRYYFIKHYIDDNQLNLEYLPTHLMIADILTKSLQGTLFKHLRNKLLNLQK
jgi:hypothetical protein